MPGNISVDYASGLVTDAPAETQNAYTDSPELHPNLIVGALQLLVWVFLHPSAWRNHVARIDPALSPNFGLLDLERGHWRNPFVKDLVIQAAVIVPALTYPLVALLLWFLVDNTEALAIAVCFNFALGVTTVALSILAFGIPGGMVTGLFVASLGTLVIYFSLSQTDVANSRIVFLGYLSLGGGILGSTIATSADPKQGLLSVEHTGRIIIGTAGGVIMGGVVLGFASFLAGSLAAGLVLNGAAVGGPGGLPAILYGILTGLLFATMLILKRVNRFHSVVSGAVVAFSYGLGYNQGDWGVENLQEAMLLGLGGAAWFITFFGFPFVLTWRLADIWSGAVAGALGVTGAYLSYLLLFDAQLIWLLLPAALISVLVGLSFFGWFPALLYPVTAVWDLLLYHLDRRPNNGVRSSLLKYHSAFWNERQTLPLFGLEDHLLLVADRNPAEYQAAVHYLITTPQRWAAQAAQIELEARFLAQRSTVEAMGQVHHSLARQQLVGPASTIIQEFHHHSQDVEAALNQGSRYHRRLAFGAIERRLHLFCSELTRSSENYAARFYPIALQWRETVAAHVQALTEAAHQSREIENPYIFGIPLTEQQEIFTGRADIVGRIEQLLLDQQPAPLLLYGQRRMGKTSLLQNLGRLLPQTIMPVFIDGQAVALGSSTEDFLQTISQQLVLSVRKLRGITIPALDQTSPMGSPFTTFIHWLNQIETALQLQKSEIMILLMVDELDELKRVIDRGRFDGDDMFSLLRHLIQHQRRFKVLLSASHALEEFERWASYLINVQVIKISYLNQAEARQLITRPTRSFTLEYEPPAVQQILDLTRGHPALVQLLCSEIVTLKNKQPITSRSLVQLNDVAKAVPRALERGHLFFANIKQNLVDPDGLSLLKFLAVQGAGARLDYQILAQQVCSPETLQQTLIQLLQRDLIELIDGTYRFQVELIRRWFAENV